MEILPNMFEIVLTKYFENYYFMKNRLIKGEVLKCGNLKSKNSL